MKADGYFSFESITVTAYWLSRGKPTCAIDFAAGNVCQFYRSIGIKGVELCSYTETNLRRDVSEDENPTYGYLIPCDNCPIHNKYKED